MRDVMRSDNYNYVGGAQYLSSAQEVELTTTAENSVGAMWSKEVARNLELTGTGEPR